MDAPLPWVVVLWVSSDMVSVAQIIGLVELPIELVGQVIEAGSNREWVVDVLVLA